MVLESDGVKEGKMTSGERLMEEEPLSPIARLFQSPRLNCCIMAVIGCKTTIDVDTIKMGLEHTLIKHPRFSSLLHGHVGIRIVLLSGALLHWAVSVQCNQVTSFCETINDVILGITQAGLSRYLNRRYDEGVTKQRNNLPRRIRLRAALLVNFRPSARIEALTIHWLSYGNKMIISVAVDQDVIPVPHQLCNDMEESLKLIKDAVLKTGLIKDAV